MADKVTARLCLHIEGFFCCPCGAHQDVANGCGKQKTSTEKRTPAACDPRQHLTSRTLQNLACIIHRHRACTIQRNKGSFGSTCRRPVVVAAKVLHYANYSGLHMDLQGGSGNEDDVLGCEINAELNEIKK